MADELVDLSAIKTPGGRLDMTGLVDTSLFLNAGERLVHPLGAGQCVLPVEGEQASKWSRVHFLTSGHSKIASSHEPCLRSNSSKYFAVFKW